MPTVLVVDDEPDILLLHRLTLESAGHRVVLAADGVTALERMSDQQFDAVVLDVRMPVLDGWQVLERMATYESPPPVLVVSAHLGADDVVKAQRLGAADWINKPFDQEDFLRRVANLVQMNGQTGGDG